MYSHKIALYTPRGYVWNVPVLQRSWVQIPYWDWIFFRPYFHYYLRCVHCCEDLFHIHVFICSSHIWFSHIHSHNLVHQLTWLCKLATAEFLKLTFRASTLCQRPEVRHRSLFGSLSQSTKKCSLKLNYSSRFCIMCSEPWAGLTLLISHKMVPS